MRYATFCGLLASMVGCGVTNSDSLHFGPVEPTAGAGDFNAGS